MLDRAEFRDKVGDVMDSAPPHRNPPAPEGDASSAAVRFAEFAEAERRRLPLWTPVLAGLGVWLFFALPVEPSRWLLVVTLGLPVVVVAAGFARGLQRASLALLAAAVIAAGFAAATLRADAVSGPVLPQRISATVEGTVASLSRSGGGRPRATLAEPLIFGLSAEDTPRRIRVTLLEGDFARDVSVGDRIAVFARLSPPQGPVEPGGFDFRRHAWFASLGAVGYAVGPAVAASTDPPGETLGLRIARWRGALAEGIVEALPEREGGFAAAILVGSRADVGEAELQALRDSNLAHLLAISGLHMGLLAALTFAVVRLAIAAAPGAALRFPSKKIAAVAALLAGAAYLVLSGASVATQRAFVMAAAALVAVMLDRPAISLRALAAAATLILLIRPESLLNAGFQMSFAATTALVAVYERARAFDFGGAGEGGFLRGVLVFAAGLALTSLVAGVATSPFAAAHFNRITHYGLLANLAAVPIMSFWVMPAGALAGLLAPLGLAGAPLWIMGQGIAAILWIAETVAAWPGAVRPVAAAPAASLPLIALGGLWLALWRTRWRWAGAAAAALGLALWTAGGARPDVLIAPRAAALGVLGPEGRAVDRPRGAGYAIASWLERDGDGASQEEAAQRPGVLREGPVSGAELSNGWRVEVLRGRGARRALRDRCAPRSVIAVWAVREADLDWTPDCILLGRDALARLGAVAIDVVGDGVRIHGSADTARFRRWATSEDDDEAEDPRD